MKIFLNYLNENKNLTKDYNENEVKVVIFKDQEISNIESEIKYDLTKFKTIKFIDCTFSNCFSDDLIINKNCELIFEKCTIQGEFRHIFCESIIFKDSEIEKYYFNNPSEDKIKIKDLLFFNSKIDNLELEGVVLKKQLIKNNNNIKEKFKEIKSLILKNCSIEKNFIIDSSERKKENDSKRFKITELDLTNSTFEENTKVKIQFCDINKAIFYNTKFKDLADFYQSKFEKVNFERTDFEKISVFSESEFYCDVNFNYTKFLATSIFKDTVITGKLNLRDTIFKDEANFLDIKLSKVGNRETARIIKDSFEQQNNIIEANKYYALEMKEREKELEENLKNGKNFFEWLVFKIHGISSNHSQDWTLSLFWIFIVGFIASYYDFNLIQNSENKYIHYNLSSIFKTIGLIFIILFIDRLCKIKDKFVNISYFIISSYLIYIYATEDYLLSLFSQTINPFSVMKTNDPINGIQLFFKIIIAYLIYQLIISIRQNTRRK